jgi:hypothetical protein
MGGHEDNPKFHSLKVLLSKNQGGLNFGLGAAALGTIF